MPVLKFAFNAEGILSKLQGKQDLMLSSLSEKMTYLMTRLQEKSRERSKGRIAESVRDPRAELEGKKIIGKLDWGGPQTEDNYKGKAVDFAVIFEKGAVPHAINPLTKGGTREHVKGAKRRVGKENLKFYSEILGKEVFADYVFHPGVVASHFMQNSLQEMRDEIKSELYSTVVGVIQK